MSNPSPLEEAMQQALLPLSLTEQQQQRCVRYIELLAHWNKTYNLTAVRDPLEMIDKHVIDSLAIEPYVQGRRVLDVGSGAGLPGLILAIVNPDRHYCLLDANSKKTRFIKQVVIELNLSQVTVVQQRVESYQVIDKYDVIVSRAFAALPRFIELTRHLLAPDGKWLAMKAQIEPEELAVKGAHIDEVIALPIEGKCRHLVQLSQTMDS